MALVREKRNKHFTTKLLPSPQPHSYKTQEAKAQQIPVLSYECNKGGNLSKMSSTLIHSPGINFLESYSNSSVE
jgi:hypothetical protein